MDLTYLLQQIVNGISLGSIYALVAIGFSITYSILRLINFAHGDILMVACYTAFFLLLSSKFPLPLAIFISMLVAGLLGVLVERIAFRPLRAASEEAMLITSIAVSILLQNLGILILSPSRKSFPSRFSFPKDMKFTTSVLTT